MTDAWTSEKKTGERERPLEEKGSPSRYISPSVTMACIGVLGAQMARRRSTCSPGTVLAKACKVRLGEKEFNGPRVKSYSVHRLSDLCFFIPGMTPGLKGTVFSRPGLHLQVLGCVIYSTAVFILAPILMTWPNLGSNPTWAPLSDPLRGSPRNDERTFEQGQDLYGRLYVNQVLDVFGILFSLLLSRYVYMAVQTCWVEARNKRGNVMRDTQLVIGLLLSVWPDLSDLDKEGKAFGVKMRCLLRLGPEITIRFLEGKRGAGLGRSLSCCSTSTFSQLDGIHKHLKITKIYREAIKLVARERERENGALIKMTDEIFAELLLALNRIQASCASMLSSVNPQKLPFSYVHLIQWGSRLVWAVYIFDLSIDISEYALHWRCSLPFTCIGGTGCSTIIWLGLAVCICLTSYIVLGLLDLHGAISNLYASDCGNVQSGFLHGLDVSTLCLVECEALSLSGEVEEQFQEKNK